MNLIPAMNVLNSKVFFKKSPSRVQPSRDLSFLSIWLAVSRGMAGPGANSLINLARSLSWLNLRSGRGAGGEGNEARHDGWNRGSDRADNPDPPRIRDRPLGSSLFANPARRPSRNWSDR